MKPYLPWLLLILGAVAVFLLWPEPEDLSGFEQREKLREAHISSLQQDYEKLKARLKADSVVYSTTIQTYQNRGKILTREIARIKANPIIVKVREDVPLVDSAFQAYDSLLASKDSQIHIAEKYISDLQMDLKSVTANFDERLKLQSETIEDLNAIVDDQRKTIRKERRNKRLAKILVPVVAVGAFLLGEAF